MCFWERATTDSEQVQIFSASTGTYRISVTGPVADDHGNTPATATLLLPGSPEIFVTGDTGDPDAVEALAFDLDVLADFGEDED